MNDSRLPTEVELVFEVMPCNAIRTAQEPIAAPHPCTYFRRWGAYHSYDYVTEGPPPQPGIVHKTKYIGRAPVVPELLSGCRKAPILAVGINPNLPGWWSFNRGSLNPLFDDYKQYAHFFRYRATSKLALSKQHYEDFGGGPGDTPFSNFILDVPTDDEGNKVIDAILQQQKMYEAYQDLLARLASKMSLQDHKLSVGKDLSYGNMVACPSARWTTQPLPTKPGELEVPPMTEQQRDGIVTECFHKRKYFLRQLFQSLPSVLLVFSQTTADVFINEMQDNFAIGNPQPGEPISELIKREIRLHYGDLPNGTALDARVVFSPHITGNPGDFEVARDKVVDQLVREAQAGRLKLNPITKHLARSRGACVFCTMLEIGKCDYADELKPINTLSS